MNRAKRTKTPSFTIDFEPLGRKGKCQAGQSLLACAQQLSLGLNSICAGQGVCHSCKVKVLDGTVSKPTNSELSAFTPQEIKEGWRLACQTYLMSNCKLYVPPESLSVPQRLQVEGLEVTFQIKPPIRFYELELAPPSLSAPRADVDHLFDALKQQHGLSSGRIDLFAARSLSEQLRSWNWKCQVAVRNEEVIAAIPRGSPPLGLAVDLGTTKIAGYLVDLSEGQTLATQGVMNPQISLGEDIISRLNAAIYPPGRGAELQRLAVGALNELCRALRAEVGAKAEEILEAVVVGNTAMHHLFLGLPVKQLALSPFIPVVRHALDIKARDLGLQIAPGGFVHLLPNIAGFVGADHVALLLATEPWQMSGPVIVLDIGTNTEVSLIKDGQITTVSCASGPAFEGGHIRDGMRAAPGAIEHLRLIGDSVLYQTVDRASPAGICGSGMLDALAQLYLAGIVDESGKFVGDHPRLIRQGKEPEFVLVSREERDGRPAISITQHDLRELQLAKAAIRAGIQVLLEANGCAEDEIKQVIIAGAFGTYIDVASAMTVGMLPALPLSRFQQVGNAAGIGAKLALLSLDKRAEALAIASRVRYLELATTPNFGEIFVSATYLGRYRITNGKREVIE